MELKSRLPQQTWYEWFWRIRPLAPAQPTDAATNPALREHFTSFLDHTDPPATFRPIDVAQAVRPAELKEMGYKTWEEVVPAVYELAWEMREFGECVILRKGVVVGEDVTIQELDGPVRIGRARG